jgi:hypothetical protein
LEVISGLPFVERYLRGLPAPSQWNTYLSAMSNAVQGNGQNAPGYRRPIQLETAIYEWQSSPSG